MRQARFQRVSLSAAERRGRRHLKGAAEVEAFFWGVAPAEMMRRSVNLLGAHFSSRAAPCFCPG